MPAPSSYRLRRVPALALAAALVAGCTPPATRVPPGAKPEARLGALAVTAGVEISTELGRNARSFVQDNLWTDGSEQFAVWVDPADRPVVGRRALGSPSWERFDLARVPGNPLGSPAGDDPHNVFAVAVDAQGFVHVAGNMHSSHLRYVRSQHPRDITSWVPARMVGKDERDVTYPAFVRRADGGLLFFYRDGRSGHGRVLANVLEPGESSWRRLPPVLDGRPSRESPYLNHIAVDPASGSIHIMYVWRRSRDPKTNNDIGYARSRDGGRSWEAADGRRLPSPVTHGSSDVVLDTAAEGSGIANSGGLELDAAGRPHGLFGVRGDGEPRHHLHVWHDGHRWRRERLCAPVGRGRPTLVTTPGGAVLAGLLDPRGEDLEIVLVDMTAPEGPRRHSLGTIPDVPWELTFDTPALEVHAVLRMLVPATATGEGEGSAVVLELPLRDAGPSLEEAPPRGPGDGIVLADSCR